MPHIKVKQFAENRIRQLIESGDKVIKACAVDADAKLPETAVRLVLVDIENESFVLEVHNRNDSYLIKAEKSTRPLDANKIKKALKYLAEKAEMHVVQENIKLSESKPALAEEYSKNIRTFESFDPKGRKVAVEVGFGSGRHLLYRAKTNPQTLYIGIEIHTPSARQVLKQINLQGLQNIWIVNYDARLLLEMLPSNSIDMIYVHFPVPWDKKPHRRVISSAFVEESARVLKQNGALELRTDSQKYYFYALEVFSALERTHFEVAKNSEAVVRSKYEDRWQRFGKDIYTLTFYADGNSPDADRQCRFDFENPPLPVKNLVSLPLKSIVRQDYFVHFGKRYLLDGSRGVLLKCSFGSFDRPEHKMLLVSRDNISYFPHQPVRTNTNCKAHQTIGEYICQT